jgi:hypothetical protein
MFAIPLDLNVAIAGEGIFRGSVLPAEVAPTKSCDWMVLMIEFTGPLCL